MEAISHGKVFNPYIVLAMHRNTSVEVVEDLICHFDMQTPHGNEVQLIDLIREFFALKFGHSVPSVELWRAKNPSLEISSRFNDDSIYAYYVRDAITESLAILNFHVLAVAESAATSTAHYAAICLPQTIPNSIRDFLKPYTDLKEFLSFIAVQINHAQDEILGLTETLLNPANRRMNDALLDGYGEGADGFVLPAIKPHSSKSIGLRD